MTAAMRHARAARLQHTRTRGRSIMRLLRAMGAVAAVAAAATSPWPAGATFLVEKLACVPLGNSGKVHMLGVEKGESATNCGKAATAMAEMAKACDPNNNATHSLKCNNFGGRRCVQALGAGRCRPACRRRCRRSHRHACIHACACTHTGAGTGTRASHVDGHVAPLQPAAHAAPAHSWGFPAPFWPPSCTHAPRASAFRPIHSPSPPLWWPRRRYFVAANADSGEKTKELLISATEAYSRGTFKPDILLVGGAHTP